MGHYHILRIDGLDWAHLDNPECMLYFKIWTPNHICKTPPFPCKETQSQVLGITCGHLWGHYLPSHSEPEPRFSLIQALFPQRDAVL